MDKKTVYDLTDVPAYSKDIEGENIDINNLKGVPIILLEGAKRQGNFGTYWLMGFEFDESSRYDGISRTFSCGSVAIAEVMESVVANNLLPLRVVIQSRQSKKQGGRPYYYFLPVAGTEE